MGRLIYSMSVSLDGYVNDAGGSLDWVQMDEEIHAWFNDRAREAGAFVYGRRLWETMAAYWPDVGPDGDAHPVEVEFAEIWKSTPKFVVSSTLSSVGHGARLVRGNAVDVVEAVTALRSEFSGDLDLGGATLAAEFVRRGLIDEYRLVIHPVTLGAGTRFLPPLDAPLSLRLVESGRFASGAVRAIYRPA